MAARRLHVVHLLIRDEQGGKVRFLVYPHDKWLKTAHQPYLVLPTKKAVGDPLAAFIRGVPVEELVDAILREDLHLGEDDCALEEELVPVRTTMRSPSTGRRTTYTVYPIDIWVDPVQREPLRARVNGQWLTCRRAVGHPQVSPTARSVFELILQRERRLNRRYRARPEAEQKPRAPRRLVKGVPDRPSIDALAMRWFSRNKAGVRHLPRQVLNEILDAGDRAFNLRVADPYLRYQMQGVGFTWSFFTHKDKQDVHVHGAPVVEIYGILEGRMEVWWKPYCDRGTSAWNHQILDEGDWVEVDSLQCHIVHWLAEGRGVVFKAGPGPLAGVGRIGTEGKTSCKDCPYSCVKPQEVIDLQRSLSGRAGQAKKKPSGKRSPINRP